MKKLIVITLAILIAAIPTFAAPKKKSKKATTTTTATNAQMEQSFLSYWSQSIGAFKKQLPQKMEPIGDMTGLDFSTKTRCTTLTIKVSNPALIEPLKADSAGVQMWCESLLSMFIGNPKTEPQLGEMMTACKFCYKYVFKDSVGNQIVTHNVSAKRFAQYYKRAKLIATADPKKMNLAYFKELVETANQSVTSGEKVHMEGHVIYDDMYCDSISTARFKLFLPGGDDTLKAYFQNVAAGIEADWKQGTGVDRLVAMERLNITEEMRLYDVDKNLLVSYTFTPADLRNPSKDADWNYFIYIINHQFNTDEYKTYFADNKIITEASCDVENALNMKYLSDTDVSMLRENIARSWVMEWAPYIPQFEQRGIGAEMRFYDAADKTLIRTLTFTAEDLNNALKKLQQ